MLASTVLPSHAKTTIVGAGPVGSCLALALSKAHQDVLLLESTSLTEPFSDTRTLALSWSGIQTLEANGVSLKTLNANLIDAVHVWQQNTQDEVTLDKSDIQFPHLGAVVTYQQLRQVLQQKILKNPSPCLTIYTEHLVHKVRTVGSCAQVIGAHQQHSFFLTTDLAVLAEGGVSENTTSAVNKRNHDYRQWAIAAEVAFDQPPDTTAYECFSSHGPFALLPYHDHFKLLWSCPTHEANLRYQHTELLATQLQEAMGNRLGKIQRIRPTQLFPLTLKRAQTLVKGHVAVIGAAAQTLHPIAGQGFNLGLRDALHLSEYLLNKKQNDSLAEPLARYAKSRRMDRSIIIALTHCMAKACEHPQGAWLRSLGIHCLDRYNPIKQRFMMCMIFGVYGDSTTHLPDLKS